MSRSFKHGISNALMARLSGYIREPREDLSIPSLIGRYKVLRRVGVGASAEVFEAEDLQLGRRVAVKVLDSRSSDAFVRRFHREASLAANLQHAGIVTIHEVSMLRKEDSRPVHYLVMDYYERSLEDVLEAGELSLRERVGLLEQVARAVQHAHEMGVVHRDLKPGNILLDREGSPVVTDFGLAREESQATQLTKSGAPVGTPAYMSPEQVEGRLREIGPHSDLYSLGIILYRLLTDRVPFDGTNPGQVYAAILTGDPARPREHSTEVDRDIETVCLKAIEKDPGHRHESVQDFADELARWLAGEPILASSPSPLRRFRRKMRGKGAWISGAAGVLLAAVIAVAIVPRWISESARRREAEEAARAQQEEKLRRVEALARARPFLETGRGILESMRMRMTRPDHTAKELESLASSAEKQFREAIRRNPHDPEPFVQIARVLALSGNPRGALDEIEAALRKDPTYAGAYLERVRILIVGYEQLRHLAGGGVREETGDLRDLRMRIEEDLRKVSEHSSRIIEIMYAKALLAFSEGDYDECQLMLKEYLDEVPTDETAWYWRGHALIHLDRDREAVDVLTRAIEYNARYASAYHSRALAKSAIADYRGSIADYDRVIEIDPEHGAAWHNRGLVHRVLGEPEAALADLNRAVEIGPADPDNWARRGEVLEETGDLAGALRDFSEAIRRSATDMDLRLQRGNVLMKLGQFQQAMEDYSVVLHADESNALAWFNRGLAHHSLGDLRWALHDYTRALEVNRNYVDAIVNRGNVLKALGDVEGAMHAFNHAIREHRDPDAYVNRGILYSEKGDHERAIQDYTSSLAIQPKAQTYVNRGIAYLAVQRTEDAIADFTEAIRRKPEWATGY